MESHKGTRTPPGASQPRQSDSIRNGQQEGDSANHTDSTGGGQLTSLQENAARDKAGTNTPAPDAPPTDSQHD